MIVGILALLNFYAGERVIVRWPWASQHWGLALLGATAFFVLQLAGPFGDRLLFPKLRRGPAGASLVLGLDWTSYVAFGALTLLVVYGLAADVITLTWKLLRPPADLAAFDWRSLQVLLLSVAGTVVLGLWQASHPVVQRVRIPLRGLPTRFTGFQIAQVSDLHVGPTIRRARVQRVVNLVNGLAPDLVALTGDLVDGSVRDLAAHVAPIAQLRAPHGVYFVTGNHEYYWNAVEWMAEFARLGVRVLANEHRLIERGPDAIVLAGITDYSTLHLRSPHASNPERALAGTPDGLVKIVLAHQPASFAMTHAAGFDLQLSGHTHAGQYFPFTLLVRFFQRYYKGLNRYRNMWIYVSRGTGYWGPPLRACMPAEITLITLAPEHGTVAAVE